MSGSDYIFLEYLIINKSWWDTVDWLASHGVGSHLKMYNSQKYTLIDKWSNSGNLWLIRTCIIFQLFYKKETENDLLAALILKHSNTKEFFLNKACGWSLRQYSKSNPQWVEEFIDLHSDSLNKLTITEGLKWLNSNKL